MSVHKLALRPDLRPLFGTLAGMQNDELLDRLAAVDGQLLSLAEQASTHVGVPYEVVGLSLALRPDGTALGIDGGPSGEAGDIWFDISPADGLAGPPWVVESRLVVFCSDSPEPRGEASTHDLVRLEASANTPSGVLAILESHVYTMRTEVAERPRETLSSTPHSQLP